MLKVQSMSPPIGLKSPIKNLNSNAPTLLPQPQISPKPYSAPFIPSSQLSTEDELYFLNYINSFNVIYQESEECVFIKDSQLLYRSVTPKQLKLVGASSAADMLGKSFAEVIVKTPFYEQKLIDQLTAQDLRILSHKKPTTFLEVLNYNGENKIFIHYKQPIINGDTGNCLGIRGRITNLILPHAVKTLLKMHGAKGLLMGHKSTQERTLSEYPLSNIQHMVLFLAMNNYSYSEISVLLCEFGQQVTAIRVNDYLEQLKLIFHVRNKAQLIEKAIGLGLHTDFPLDLFNKLASIDISEDTATIINSNNIKPN